MKSEKLNCSLPPLEIQSVNIKPATKFVIPAAAERRAGIQKKPYDYWIPVFAGMTGAIIKNPI